MIIDIKDAKKQLSNHVDSLIERKEDIIYISKSGKPIAQLSLIKHENKRIGVAKNEMKGFILSLEDFNSIPTGF